MVEVIVPKVRRVPPGEQGWFFVLRDDHVGIETFGDVIGQIAWSRHWIDVEGRLVRHSVPYRYPWPSELDLMAQLAGLWSRDWWVDWHRSPFTSASSRWRCTTSRHGGDGP